MPQPSARYNLKWGNTTKSTPSATAQEMCATYKRKIRTVLAKNKALVRALATAKTEMAELKEAASRWDKIEGLYLPMLKRWLEADMGPIRALFENHVRVTSLLKDLLTPGANVSLTAADSLLKETACESPASESPASEPAALHPPGSRYCDQDRSMSMVLEEDEDNRTEVVEPLHDLAETPEPEISRSSRVTVRKKSSRSGRRCSLPGDEPLPVSVDQPPVVPSFAVVDQEASILVAEITGQEKNVVCAETVVVPPPDKLKGHSAHEYSAAFSHRPKIPRTPCSAAEEDSRFNPWSEDVGSSPALARVQRRRASEAALPLWPGRRVSAIRPRRNSIAPGAMAQGFLARRLSGPADSSLLSPTGVLDATFVESPSPTQVLRRSIRSPGKVADFRRDENSPPEARTRHRKSAFKSRPSEGVQKKRASRVTFFVQKGRTEMAGDTAEDPINDTAIPPAQRVDGQWEKGGGDGPRDGAGGTQQQRPSAVLDAGGPRPRGNTALHPRQDHCVDEKPPQARKSRGKKSQGLKETADHKAPAPPQLVSPCSPHTRRSGCLPLAEPAAADRSSLVGEGSPPRRSSGRPARTATKCATYKEINLNVKLRRP